jgi:UDP-GlcNAc:undecaprenyl-phosphate GlcNAc-1-phosphate transferase
MIIPHLISAILGFALAYGMLPLVIRAAHKHGILDRPTEARRIHHSPIPRLGGVAVFGATVVTVLVVYAWDHFDRSFFVPFGAMRMGMVIGSTMVFATGFVDDLRGLKPAVKLAAQTAASMVVVAFGFRIHSVTLAGQSVLDLGPLSVPITLLWIVGMTNAFNLIDGVDGLAGTMGLIGLTSCIAADFIVHGFTSLILTFALLGAVFAFLRYNHPPAKIFLGDSGSMLLGFFMSIRSVQASTGDNGATFALVPLFALAYPLTDTFIAIARRWLRGHPLSRADGRHIHHQVLATGLSAQRAVELLGLVFFGVAFMGISIVFAPPAVTMALGVAGAVLCFATFVYGVKWLRYSEFTEFGASVASVLLNARSHVRNKLIAGEIADRLLQAESLEQVNEMLDECATDLQLIEVSIMPGAQHMRSPLARQISPLSERPFRVDFPIAWEQDGEVQEVVLRMWCERPDERRHIGTERIASRLGGALEAWFRQNPAALDGIAAAAEVGKRQAEGGARQAAGVVSSAPLRLADR